MEGREQIVLKVEAMANRMRRNAFSMALAAGAASSHFGGGLSIIDITATLFGAVMRYDKNNAEWSERDRFILSKGHGVLGYYTALVEAGFVPQKDLKEFEKTGSYLLGHPVMNRSKGIEFTNGSLGMGLSLGVGVAIAGKRRNRNYKVYVLMGDGECNEGSIWEAAMAATQFKLDNLIGIIDKNNCQLGGLTSEVMCAGDMATKWRSFGWEVVEVDGHNINQLYNAFSRTYESGKPLAVVADTIKGKGASFAENNNAWHHAVLTKAQYEIACDELNQRCRMD